MLSANQQHLEAASASYAALFNMGHLALPPTKRYLVLTCMDARIDPAKAFGIELGDAHVIRNAGGSAVDGLRSIIISQQLLGTHEVVLVKHTGCGMVTFRNEDAYELVEQKLGTEAAQELKAKKFDFLPFAELEQALRDDIDFIRGSKLVPPQVVLSGWIYEVETGRTRRVV
ncbi:carbonic anhydrase [Plectosphaerella cucumerina]|uniref:Carbonic anhydrase n=1 Tax=Plectosphaerella cucumerina TaxID=40658 RepID=A0A8K0TMM6_9PEZI|nr:carbonic anhydrase [Plectosphaerella cucumerina]